ncbi:MAG TPA: nuclear transport factor 2 family protein [Candidatus Flavonifractor intestinipullorum]|uniref:Nuclear transport factor 2 family protein n=1 Tax=Candidatus Flavonifractor intestinipullorum TaxID=2838587 RepID=A0A9D2S585_9FIRM|nr:nuclear transport factor 2 family protein [Candidatus Flavonifractor intestinipullorum]
MGSYQFEKRLVLDYYNALEQAAPDAVPGALERFLGPDYAWRSSYPFRTLEHVDEVAGRFWSPLKRALTHMQRRIDVFIAGNNELDGTVWVMSMGHFMGLFDHEILGIRPTRKMASLRYAEFNCVQGGKITQTGLFLDWIGLMHQAGVYPLPPMTGQYFIYPGPRTHDGLLFADAPAEEGVKTLKLVNQMVDDLDKLNQSGSMEPPSVADLSRSWAEDMIWYGPCGIGATYTIPRYIEQHTGPFRRGLTGKTFHGHAVRLAEGKFACFFGWPNLTNRNAGGFLGLPAGESADMMVVDVYCRQGDKLSENWVLIDLPWWLKQQGLDIFERTRSIFPPNV